MLGISVLFLLGGVQSLSLQGVMEREYDWEIVAFVVILLLIVFFIIGSSQNKKVVDSFFSTGLDLFKENFYHVGLKLRELSSASLQEVLEDPEIMEKDSPNFFRVIFTGRFNLKYCIVSVNTKRRQDKLISLITSIFWPEKDRVLLECAMPDYGEEKGLLYVLNKNKVKNMIQDYEDLRTLCKSYNIQSLKNKKLKVFAESHETIEAIMDRDVQEAID